MNDTHQATYCPEDDKIRLYVGYVPRDEYLALRKEGWKSTPKQDCDFVATWTPAREDTALDYAGIITDEDQSPQDRAADRAERFAEYREKRAAEACGHADRYESGPAVHGYQDKARAVRAADRHDRIASRAVNSWDKAEYWQARTAGVITSALYKSRPDVRMGRIKRLESDLRKAEASLASSIRDRARLEEIIADPAGFIDEMHARLSCFTEESTAQEITFETLSTLLPWSEIKHPRTGEKERVYRLTAPDHADPLTLLEALTAYLEQHPAPPSMETGTRYIRHLRNRLAYENQMLEAQGGRDAHTEMTAGGTLGSFLVVRVYKSPATGRVTSVDILRKDKPNGWEYRTKQIPGTDFYVCRMDTERMAAGTYQAPTDESKARLAEFEAAKQAQRATKPKKPALINPTDPQAEQIQAAWNEAAADAHAAAVKEYRACDNFTPSEILRMTQAEYSARSKGNYSTVETRHICGAMKLDDRASNMWSSVAEARKKARGPMLAKVRIKERSGYYSPPSLIIITDKPQKPLPAAVFQPYTPQETQAPAEA